MASNLSIHPRSRTATLAAATTLTAALLLAGCGAARDDGRAGARADGTPATSATPPTTGGTTVGTGSAPTTAAPADGATSAATSADATPYASAVTDEVVANPAFAPLGKDITRRIEAAGLPGAGLLVLHDGELVEQETYGGYDLTTRIPIASASKWLAGATIMSVVDDGLIDLDEPIRTYLPGADGPSGQITTRQLLDFTSGLEYDERIPCYNDTSMTLAACNELILDLPLLGKPGTGYRYTGTHLHVAAGVAEAVTGQTFEELFQERIARPLGMTDTSFLNPLRSAGGAPDGHPGPAGTGISSLGDYGRFLEMLVHDGVAPDGTRLLSSESVAEMSTVQTAGTTFVSAAAARKAAKTPYGLAHWIDVADADGHAQLESSPGAFGFRPWIDSVNHIAGVYMVKDDDDERVADSPDKSGAAVTEVQTSGIFVVNGTAKALGVTSPEASPR